MLPGTGNSHKFDHNEVHAASAVALETSMASYKQEHTGSKTESPLDLFLVRELRLYESPTGRIVGTRSTGEESCRSSLHI